MAGLSRASSRSSSFLLIVILLTVKTGISFQETEMSIVTLPRGITDRVRLSGMFVDLVYSIHSDWCGVPVSGRSSLHCWLIVDSTVVTGEG